MPPTPPLPLFSGLERRKKPSRTGLKPREAAVLSFRQRRRREKEAFAINPRLRCAIGWWTSQAKQIKKKKKTEEKQKSKRNPPMEAASGLLGPVFPFVLFIASKQYKSYSHLLRVKTRKNRKIFLQRWWGKGVEMPSVMSLHPLERKQGTQLKQSPLPLIPAGKWGLSKRALPSSWAGT